MPRPPNRGPLLITAAFAAIVAFGEGPAAAQIRAACEQQYAAKEPAGETGGQDEETFVKACLADAKPAPDPEEPGSDTGRVFRGGKLPINLSLSAFYNLVKPQSGPDWQLRTQLTLIF
jgi:hypothetical protein